MGKYVVCAGQNLYDVALHLYGSVEGVTDLLVSNPQLSFSTLLRPGDELEYTEGYVIDREVVLYNRLHGVVPANGERGVYVKVPSLPLLFAFCVKPEVTCGRLVLSGRGMVEMDWGDNSPLQVIVLEDEEREYVHSFDWLVSQKRQVRMYGEVSLRVVDFTGLRAGEVFLLSPLWVEVLALNECAAPLSFLALTQGVYALELRKIQTYSLLPLLVCRDLMRVDLSGSLIRTAVLDEYLIGLVQEYQGRRSCEVILSSSASGVYREPEKDGNGRYRLTSGMEAVWVLTHEPAWNEGGHWKICINDHVFEYGKND